MTTTLKELTELLLKANEVDRDKRERIAINFGLKKDEVTNKVVLIANIIEEALGGNTKAYETLKDIIQGNYPRAIDSFLDL